MARASRNLRLRSVGSVGPRRSIPISVPLSAIRVKCSSNATLKPDWSVHRSLSLFARAFLQEAFRCDFQGHCEVNILNRHICTACRLAKCFAVGMRTELIRCSRQTKNNNNNTSLSTVQATTEFRLTLNADEWNLISNVRHSYEIHSAVRHVEDYLQKQKNLPVKLRCKSASITELFTLIFSEIEQFYRFNGHFHSLSAHDRSILLHNSLETISSLGGLFILRQVMLSQCPSFKKSIETIYGSSLIVQTERLLEQIDPDETLIKLAITLFAFSSDPRRNSRELDNRLEVMRIQHLYADLTWKYLLVGHDDQQAVRRFVRLIRCVLLINQASDEAQRIDQHRQMIDKLLQQVNSTFEH